MAYRLNPLTGKFDIVSTTGGGTAFDPDTILTGPTQCVFVGPTIPLEVLIDNNGNVLIGL